MNAAFHARGRCCLFATVSVVLMTSAATAGIFSDWTHSGGDEDAIRNWLFEGTAFDQVGPQGNAHYFGIYETPWSADTVDLEIGIAIRTPAPLVLPPPLGVRYQTWQPYLDRWPASISLGLYNFRVQQFDVTAVVGYTGGTLPNSADFQMVAPLMHPADADKGDRGIRPEPCRPIWFRHKGSRASDMSPSEQEPRIRLLSTGLKRCGDSPPAVFVAGSFHAPDSSSS